MQFYLAKGCVNRIMRSSTSPLKYSHIINTEKHFVFPFWQFFEPVRDGRVKYEVHWRWGEEEAVGLPGRASEDEISIDEPAD